MPAALLLFLLVALPPGTEPASLPSPTTPPTPAAPPPPAALTPVPSSPEVLFTFDDGPKLDTTPRVLEELKRRNIKAIFFVVGRKFEKDERARELLRTISAQGHYIGNHTYSHRILCKHLNLASNEIDRNQTLIHEVLGLKPLLLRTPYGQHCKRLREIVAEKGFERIGWDIDPQEWQPGSRGKRVAQYIIARLSKLKGRAIVLMHDTRQATVDALPIVLDWLAQHPEIKVIDWKPLLPPTVAQPTRSILLEAFRLLGDDALRALPALAPFSVTPPARWVAPLANLML